MKGWVGFDLDGTVAEKYWGRNGVKFDPAVIGPPVVPPIKDYPSPIDRIKRLLEEEVEVRIFTARVYCPPKPQNEHDMIAMEEYSRRRNEADAARAAIYAWTAEHIGQALESTCTKDYGMIALFDDLAKQVAQNTGIVLEDFVNADDVVARFGYEADQKKGLIASIGASDPNAESPLETGQITEENVNDPIKVTLHGKTEPAEQFVKEMMEQNAPPTLSPDAGTLGEEEPKAA